jgi:hypothetical protein
MDNSGGSDIIIGRIQKNGDKYGKKKRNFAKCNDANEQRRVAARSDEAEKLRKTDVLVKTQDQVASLKVALLKCKRQTSTRTKQLEIQKQKVVMLQNAPPAGSTAIPSLEERLQIISPHYDVAAMKRSTDVDLDLLSMTSWVQVEAIETYNKAHRRIITPANTQRYHKKQLLQQTKFVDKDAVLKLIDMASNAKLRNQFSAKNTTAQQDQSAASAYNDGIQNSLRSMAGTKQGQHGIFPSKSALAVFRAEVLAGTSVVYVAVMNTDGYCVYIKFPKLMELIISSCQLAEKYG